MSERDHQRELRNGGGCLALIAVLVGVAFFRSWLRLRGGADSVHPVLWPVFRAFGERGIAVTGVSLTLLLVLLAGWALVRARTR